MKLGICPWRAHFAAIIVWVVIFLLASTVHTRAQTPASALNPFDVSLGVAYYIPLKDTNAQDGQIIMFDRATGYVLTKTAYDTGMIGIVSNNPAIAFRVEGVGSHAILSNGNAYVQVSTINGAIKEGDPLTSSTKPGVAMRATKSGYVVGTALENFESTNTNEVGKILTTINIHYAYVRPSAINKLFSVLSLSALAVHEEPTLVFRYFVAGMIILIAFLLGFLSFGRVAATGIEALGRNPLAARTIQFGIILNVIVTIAIVLSGLALAYFILRL